MAYDSGMTSLEDPITAADVDRYVAHGVRQRPGPRVPFVVGPGGARPGGDRRRQGIADVGRQGRHVPRLLVPAGQRQHRPPAPADDRGHQAAGRSPVHRRPEHGQRHAQRGGAADHRAGAGRPRQGVLHQRRRRGDRERDPARQGPHRSAQGAVDVPQLPRQHDGCDHPHRRDAPARQRAGHAGGRQVLRARTSIAPSSARPPSEEECERALAHLRSVVLGEGPRPDRRDRARDRGRHERHPRPTRRLPRRRPRAVRRVRDHDDLRRGDGRLRALRRVVRRQPLGRDTRPDRVRQGRQLRLRPARRCGDLAADRRDVTASGSTRVG